MALELVKDPLDIQAEALPISSETISVGEVLDLDVGATNWTAANASTVHWSRKAVAIEAATSSDTEVKAILVHNLQLWQADAESNSDAADNGDRMLLGSGGLTVNNTGSDDANKEACFLQRAPVGPAANAQVLGYILVGSGINPDAT